MVELISAEVAVFLAGGSYVLGYLIINQIGLRLMVLLGTGFYIWYYAVVADEPLWEAIYLSMLIGAANILGLFGLLLYRSRLMIPGHARDLYERFGDLPPGDFRALMAYSTRRSLTDSEEVTTEGQAVSRLIYVISGGIEVEKMGDSFRMPAGVFIGEVAFLTGKSSSATTWVSAGSEILEWDVAELRRRSARKPRFRLALEAMISKDLAEKVSLAVAPHTKEWRPELSETAG